MTDMPEMINKPAELRGLDEALGGARQQELLDRLKAGEDPTDLAIAFGVVVPGPRADHLRTHWFGDGWWKKIPAEDRKRIIRGGLIEAIETAREFGLSVFDSYWICHAGHKHGAGAPGETAAPHEEAMEVAVGWNSQQVTIVIHTPEPPNQHWFLVKDEPTKIVRLDDEGNVVTVDQKKGAVIKHPRVASPVS